jgi:signal transduction histidine kinase
MCESREGRGRTRSRDQRLAEQSRLPARALVWRRYVSDSLFAVGGVALVTSIIASAHLYPRIPSIAFTYLLVIVVLASTRGVYAALLAALLVSFSFGFFLAPSLSGLAFSDLEDLLDPLVFLLTTVITGQIIAVLRRHAEQAKIREREIRIFSEQAQELATLHERQRLARELHDSVSQALYGISLGAHTAREALENDPREAIAPLEYVIALSAAGLDEMRAVIFELRPESLATEGIIAALSKQVAVLRTRYKLTVNVQFGEEPSLPLDQKHALYRIAQEALHNIVKHARANTILLRLVRQSNELVLEVGDDGKGFDSTGPYPGHLGLRSIRERVAYLGGSYTMESTPAQGTLLHVHVPL